GEHIGVVHVPPQWRRFDSPFHRAGVVFLHYLRSPGGHDRLVAVLFRPLPPEPRPDGAAAVSFSAVIEPAVPLGPRRQRATADHVGVLDAQLDVGDHFTLYSGQADPVDPSHFTIQYTTEGTPGTIDGYLHDDDTIV